MPALALSRARRQLLTRLLAHSLTHNYCRGGHILVASARAHRVTLDLRQNRIKAGIMHRRFRNRGGRIL